MINKDSIFALHGFTGCGSDFDALSFFLQGSITKFHAPNLHSGTMPTALNPLLLRLKCLWDELPEKKKILLGYSMGGRIALHLANAFSLDNLEKLVLISASPGLKSEEERNARKISDNALAQRILAYGNAWEFYEEWQKNPIIASQNNMPEPWHSKLLCSRKNSDHFAWGNSLRELGTGTLQPLWGFLPKIRIPTLLITGEKDEKFCKIADEMASCIPQCHRVTIEGCGHSPQLEVPEKTAEIIKDFIYKDE